MIRRLATLLLLAILAVLPARAQEANGPLMGGSGDSESLPAQHILVIGDAIGGGMGAGLQRMAALSGRYDVTIRFNEESGLARPDVYDWSATVPKILESSDFDVIVVMLGSNDRQQIRSGNLRYSFGGPEWIEAYSRRVDALLTSLMQSGARIYWVGMPPMANADYDSAMQTISELQRTRAEARGANFIDIRQTFLAADGTYTDIGPDDTGEVRKLRGRDGVSFFKQGNNRIGQIVLSALGGARSLRTPDAEAEIRKPMTGPQKEEVPVPRAVSGREPKAAPVFGQSIGQFGESLTVEPQGVVASARLIAGQQPAGSSAAVLSALFEAAQPGTAAAELFGKGKMGAAPVGRLDDYRVPAESSD